MSIITKSVSQTLTFTPTIIGVDQAMVTAYQGTKLQLTSGDQPIQLKVGNAHVTTLKIHVIYSGQSEFPSIDLTDVDGNVLQTKTMTHLANIPQDLTFDPHRGVYYLIFHNTGAGVATFSGELIFQDETSFEVGFA